MRYSKKNLDNQYKEIAFYIKNNSANLIAKNAIQIFQSLKYSNNTAYNSMISFLSEFPYWGKLDPQQNSYEYFIDKANTVKKNIEKIDWLYHNLKDLKSKTVLLGILKNWLFLDYNLLEKVRDHTAQYFDTNIFKTNSNQTFVDVGAYTGDTVYQRRL